MTTFMHWTPEMLRRFKIAYAKALEESVETFPFQGHDFVPGYAKFLIEYLEMVMKGERDEKRG
jgi:hypothetical protein